MPRPHPHLPAELVAKISRDPTLAVDTPSEIYSDEFHTVRLMIVDATNKDSANVIFEVSGLNRPKTSRADRTRKGLIHIAVELVDPLALFESLRLGSNVDLEDGDGNTAFVTAYSMLFSMRTSGMDTGGPTSVARLELIAKTLLEQHADVNRSFNRCMMTPLWMACVASDWGWIELLLEHGADPNLGPLCKSGIDLPIDRLRSQAVKTRFSNLLKLYPPTRGRPPQKCPCWSGKLLRDCHAAGCVPYPVEFYCTCGSKKPFKVCCAHRNQFVTESWDPKGRCICQIGTTSQVLPNRGMTSFGGIKTSMGSLMAHRCSVPREYGGRYALSEKGAWNIISYILLGFKIEFAGKGTIDPAFEFAMKEVLFLPRPNGRSQSKRAAEATQKLWNAAVDKYIASGAGGTRSREDIERAAKIGRSGGALYRLCEGLKCTKSERTGGTGFKVCAKCKIAVYCSVSCQTAAWKTHKTLCGETCQREQALPSQSAIQQYLDEETDTMIINPEGSDGFARDGPFSVESPEGDIQSFAMKLADLCKSQNF